MHRPLNVTDVRARVRLQRVDRRLAAGICYESRLTNGRTETEKAAENRCGKVGDCEKGEL